MQRLQTKPGQVMMITLGTMIITLGVYFFKFPNSFCFGGVTGIAVVIGRLTSWSASTATFILNAILLLVGFLFLGRQFGFKTVYATVLMSVLLWSLERIHPMDATLTDQLYLEFVLAILLSSLGSAILFNVGASSGGTDILALIIQQKTGYDTGSTLFISDVAITIASFCVFDIQSGLFSLTGLLAKTLAVNFAIRDMKLSKYFQIVCDDPRPICAFITERLHHSATVCQGIGAFSHGKKYIVFAVLGRSQAILLRNFVKETQPNSFITICNSSEIIGKGFQE